MLHNDAPCIGLVTFQRGFNWTNPGGENGKKSLIPFGGHQYIISSMHGWGKVVCSLIMPLGVD